MTWNLYCPDITFSEEQIRAALHVLSALDSGHDCIGAYLSGSLAVGLGHGTSDVDILAVMPDESRLRSGSVHTAGFEVHFNPIGVSQFRDLVDLSSADVPESQHRGVSIPIDRLQLLGKLRLARILVSSDSCEAIRRRISSQKLRQQFMEKLAVRVSDSCDTCFGCLSIHDYSSSLAASDAALRLSCDVLLASVEDFYCFSKSLFRQLARQPLAASVAPLVWELLQSPSLKEPEAEVVHLIRNRLFVANDIVFWCMRNASEGPLTSAIPEISFEPVASDGPRRSPFFTPIRFEGGMVLYGLAREFELSRENLELWRLFDGSPLMATFSRLAKILGVATEEIVDYATTSTEEMVVKGLVEATDGVHIANAAPTKNTSGGWTVRASSRFLPGWSCIHPPSSDPMGSGTRPHRQTSLSEVEDDVVSEVNIPPQLGRHFQ